MGFETHPASLGVVLCPTYRPTLMSPAAIRRILAHRMKHVHHRSSDKRRHNSSHIRSAGEHALLYLQASHRIFSTHSTIFSWFFSEARSGGSTQDTETTTRLHINWIFFFFAATDSPEVLINRRSPRRRIKRRSTRHYCSPPDS